MNCIKLRRKICTDKKISNYGLAVICALCILDADIFDVSNASINKLACALLGKCNPPRRFKAHLKQGLNELIAESVLQTSERQDGTRFLDCSNIKPAANAKENITIYRTEISKIFQLPNIDNFSLFKYFAVIISTMNIGSKLPNSKKNFKNNVMGMNAIQTLCELSGCHKQSVLKYNKALEECGLLYIYRAGNFYIEEQTGKLKTSTNLYGRPADKALIDKFAEQRAIKTADKNLTVRSASITNNRRKLAQQYIQLAKGNDAGYTPQEIRKIYNYVLAENEKYLWAYALNPNEKILDKLRDDSCFDKYDFL